MAKRIFKGLGAVTLSAGTIVTFALPSVAQAAPTMQANPNPGTVGSPVTVSNTANDSSTCAMGEGESVVDLMVTAPDSTTTHPTATPNQQTGNWSTSFTPTLAGTYTITGTCAYADQPSFGPAATPEFDYQVLSVVIQQQATTTTTSTTIRPSTTTSGPTTTVRVAAVTAVPRFTG